MVEKPEVLMINFILYALKRFRGCFSHESTWIVFCMAVLGFIGMNEMTGVTSLCRFWGLGESGYNMFLHFFRYSTAWSLAGVVQCWWEFVISQNKLVSINGRIVLQGDHTYVPKDGRRMPGVVTMRQESETQNKPSYFRGHCWGAITGLAGSLCAPFGIPLELKIHQGFVHIGKKKDKKNAITLGPRIVQMALKFCLERGKMCIFTLDAFFPSASVFRLANSVWSFEARKPVISLIVKAKKNFVAFYEAEQNESGRGRKKKYGEKVYLTEVFDHMYLFKKTKCSIYGKMEEVYVLAENFLWRPTGDFVRFVFAYTSRGPIVLMSNDLEMDALIALQLYCARTRIETTFDMLKNLIGAFKYRFWSKALPLHSRKPLKNDGLKGPAPIDVPKVEKCWIGIEKLAMTAAIALGLLQLVSIKFHKTIWNHFGAYLRTRSRDIPSERTVKYVLSGFLRDIMMKVAFRGIVAKIQRRILHSNLN